MSNINLDLQASHKMLTLLDEANANAESIIDAIPGIFLIINSDHEVLRANREFATLFGLDDEKLFRLPLSKMFRKETWRIFAHNVRQVLESDMESALAHFEMCLFVDGPDRDKAERPYHWTIKRQPTKQYGEGPLLAVFGDDISEMRDAERRLSEVFASIPLGIFTLNRDGAIGNTYSSYLEPMLDAGKLAGVAVEDALFRGARGSVDDELRGGVGAIRDCLGKPETEYESHAVKFPRLILHNAVPDPAEGRWLKISYQPIVFDGTVEQLLVILEDRTAIVKAEREMLEAARDREKAIALERQSLAMYESAIRDPLTGLFTRLYMKDAVVALMWSHDHEEVADVSLVMFDVDHFKKVNDTYGHKSGDLVLTEVARVILRQSREPEIPIRFGGEEFVVFMPTGCEAAFKLAERVRREVEGMSVDLGGTAIRVTISAGAASRARGETVEEFMSRTDQLLYRAKKNGRNRTEVDASGSCEGAAVAGAAAPGAVDATTAW